MDELTKYEDELIEAEKSISVYFENLENRFSEDKIAEIFGYFLTNSFNYELLSETIRQVNSYRFKSNIDDLIDFIMTKSFQDSKDPNEIINLKILAIKAISNFKDTKCIPALLYCLNDKSVNYKMRFQAAEALGKIGDRNAVESLINVVSDESEKSVYVRESAAVALGMIGDMRAIDPFLTILEAKKNFLGKFSFLKERVIEALGKINFSESKRILHAYKNAIEDESPRVRINAIESLMNLETQEACDLIKTRLKDEDEEVVRNAVIALYNINGKDALFEILKSDELPNCAKEQAEEIYREYEEGNE